MQKTVIEQLGPDDGERLKEIRLRALQEAPGAFGSTYAREAAFTPETWAERLRNPGTRYWVARSETGQDIGIVCVYTHREGLELVSMWVAPEARGRGVAGRLVDAAVEYARGTGADELTLWVIGGNEAARSLYVSKGFVPTGREQALPSDPTVTEVRYALSFLFREARREDVPAIVAMLIDDHLGATREGDPHDPRYLEAFDRIAANPYEELIVAERDGEVIGTMQLSYLSGLGRLGATRCQIEAVRVAAARRGEGLGRRMIQWAVDRARARGCVLVQLTSDKSRVDAHRFYDSLGFVDSHIGYKLSL
ncbi:GNAT family N-acetyltransferase [Nonomuraea pusilla]|uniref:GNAT family N-acetyltransferase n=1 Tax=Nonomuraea pusilla TaxID=46177 RepID=UPI003329AABB